MTKNRFRPAILMMLLALLVSCSDSPWEAETRFEPKLSCETSLGSVKTLAQKFQMDLKEVPLNDQTNTETKDNLLLMLFKGNNAYSFLFENGKITFVQKQGFRTWGIGNGLKTMISVGTLFRCNGVT